ncbi:hypothetical protein [Paenibacillus whitsoniae]|uniref:Uncharacterized protein n=1 Tax=Paenibacillus whitsoniae TaxID=2496558 RepID=A0A430J3P5_9BACL|nr:hypothetical protein [Paenibacillus whitsoniae]RTD99596.1 hypothetical protein EJQ19_31645 [Paenibacillus whitsoniae]
MRGTAGVGASGEVLQRAKRGRMKKRLAGVQAAACVEVTAPVKRRWKIRGGKPSYFGVLNGLA